MAETQTNLGLAPNYPHYRREVPCTSINCFTGGLRHILAREGQEISESQIWALGEGFCLRAGSDEYEVPQLHLGMFDVVERFSSKTGAEIVRVDVQPDRLLEQIVELTSASSSRGLGQACSGMVAWTNTKYLTYADLYYSNLAYLHSVVVEGLGAPGTIRLTDVLIVTLPPRACEVDVALDDFRAGVMTAPQPEGAAFTRAFVQIRSRPGLATDAASQFERSLLAGCERNLALHANASPILAYGAACERHMRQVEGDSLRGFLRRVAGNITSVGVLPNRNLAVQALTEASRPGELGAAVKDAATEMLLSWKTLANLCLKASHTLSPRDLGRFAHNVENLEKSEIRFWTAARDSLAGSG